MIFKNRLQRRHFYGRLVKVGALSSCCVVFVFLMVLFGGIIMQGIPGFIKTEILLDIDFDPQWVRFDQDEKQIEHFQYESLVLSGLRKHFNDMSIVEHRKYLKLVSPSARKNLYLMIKKKPKYIGRSLEIWLAVSDEVDAYIKGKIDVDLPDENKRLSQQQVEWVEELKKHNSIRQRFNRQFFLSSDSREPVSAGIKGAVIGSLYLMLVTLILSFPIGIASAVYLEEFARQNTFTNIIELSISNLAAVPSIIFGLLGLAVFINFMDLPRSSALVGGMTLSLMTLPTIIMASRSALRQVPRTMRDAARGLGASPIQVTFHHVVPLALPGILTGTIISMARALGETAPLLMVGMMAFIADFPALPTDAATALPVQIFTWARNPEPGFIANAAAAILTLLIFLGIMNLAAILLRNRFEYKW